MLDHKLQRRALLRLLAAGCVMSLPMVSRARQSSGVAGENSPDSSGLPTGDAGTEAVGGITHQSAAAKVSKAQAKYQDQPKADQMCANCANFISPSSCKLVEGKVSPNGWCTLWARKQG